MNIEKTVLTIFWAYPDVVSDCTTQTLYTIKKTTLWLVCTTIIYIIEQKSYTV